MATISATVISATQNGTTAQVVIEFNDGTTTWQKPYTIHQTDPIKFADFKDMVTADIRRDLKLKSQLTNLDSQVGKTFYITA